MKLVIDASVVLSWLLREPTSEDAALAFNVLESLATPAAEAFMPAIGFLEIANVVARVEAKGLVDVQRIGGFMEMLRTLPLRVDHDTAALALGPVLDLARRHRLSAYDAAYLELALRRGLPLASLDAQLAKAAAAAGVPYPTR